MSRVDVTLATEFPAYKSLVSALVRRVEFVRTREDVGHRRYVPSCAAGRPDAALVQMPGYRDHADRTSGLNGPDHRQYVRREAVCLCAQGLPSHLTRPE
jgi:hypothetical protein